MIRKHFYLFVVGIGLSVLAGFGCTHSSASQPVSANPAPKVATNGDANSYKPGLGDLMTLIQQRHAKVYFAAEAGNWDLATYELKELNEGLSDVVSLYPQFKSFDLTQIVPGFMSASLEEVSQSITAHDTARFEAGFRGVNESCTKCHSTTSHAFIVIQSPLSPEFSNLKFPPQ